MAWRRDLRGKDIFIYSIDGVRPSFRLVESVATEPTGATVLDRLAVSVTNEAVLEDKDFGLTGHDDKFDPATSALSATRLTRLFPMSRIVARDSWSIGRPYWKAEINGRPLNSTRSHQSRTIWFGPRRRRLLGSARLAAALFLVRMLDHRPQSRRASVDRFRGPQVPVLDF